MLKRIFNALHNFLQKPIIRFLQAAIYIFLQASIFVYIFLSLYLKIYFWFLISIFSFILVITPSTLKRRFDIALPNEINLAISLSLFLHIAGNVSGFYRELFWYDTTAHFISSATIAILAFTITVIVDYYIEAIKLPRYLIFFVVVLVTTAIGCYWEIAEFAFDQFLNTQYQDGNYDTMIDLISDISAGLLVGVLTTVYLKYTTRKRFVGSIDPRKTIDDVLDELFE